jgi:hypothetical protein
VLASWRLASPRVATVFGRAHGRAACGPARPPCGGVPCADLPPARPPRPRVATVFDVGAVDTAARRWPLDRWRWSGSVEVEWSAERPSRCLGFVADLRIGNLGLCVGRGMRKWRWNVANRNAGLVGSVAQEVALGSGSGLTADGPSQRSESGAGMWQLG